MFVHQIWPQLSCRRTVQQHHIVISRLRTDVCFKTSTILWKKVLVILRLHNFAHFDFTSGPSLLSKASNGYRKHAISSKPQCCFRGQEMNHLGQIYREKAKAKDDGDLFEEDTFCNFRFQRKTGKPEAKCDYTSSVYLPCFCFSFSHSLSSQRLMSLVKGNGLRNIKVLDHLVCGQAKKPPQCHYAPMAVQTRNERQTAVANALANRCV